MKRKKNAKRPTWAGLDRWLGSAVSTDADRHALRAPFVAEMPWGGRAWVSTDGTVMHLRPTDDAEPLGYGDAEMDAAARPPDLGLVLADEPFTRPEKFERVVWLDEDVAALRRVSKVARQVLVISAAEPAFIMWNHFRRPTKSEAPVLLDASLAGRALPAREEDVVHAWMRGPYDPVFIAPADQLWIAVVMPTR